MTRFSSELCKLRTCPWFTRRDYRIATELPSPLIHNEFGQRCWGKVRHVAAETPLSFPPLSPPPPPYRRNCNKLNSAFGNARERYVCWLAKVGATRRGGGRVGAIYDWRRTCDRASWKFISARTAPSDKTYYHRPSRARKLSLFPSYVAFTGIFASFLPLFFPPSFPKHVRRLRSIRKRGVSLRRALPRHR